MREGARAMPSFTKKNVMLLSYKINAPGEKGSSEIIFVQIKLRATAIMETCAPSPLNKATIVNKSVANNRI